MSEITSPAAFWDREVSVTRDTNWLLHPHIRHYVNESISGSQELWPFDWFQKEYGNRVYERGLSIGCGSGALERDVIGRGLCSTMDAFDASPISLDLARAEATRFGYGERIRYFEGDFNSIVLPRRHYDIVFFHQSLHHVSRIERLLRQVTASLRPNGLVYFDEFVGPSRTYWTERNTAPYGAMYRLLPRSVRFFDELPLPVQWEDLSEAIRSGEIESRIRIGFDIDQFRGYGGNVLSMLFPSIDAQKISNEVVDLLIEMEKRLLAVGVPHFCAVIVARPKTGFRRVAATIKYIVSPKVRRLRRALRGESRVGNAASEEDRFRL